MALDTNATKIANLLDPQVIGTMIDKKLFDYARFTPLAFIESSLVGTPGSTITLPFFNKLNVDADDVAEGEDISIAKLTESTVTATIKKIGLGVQITDEAILSGYGDPVGNATNQIAMSIANKVDNDIMTALSGATLTSEYTTFDDDTVVDALMKFGEDMDDEAKTIIMGVNEYGTLRKGGWLPASDVQANALIGGTVGVVQGCQIVTTNKITDGSMYIVKPGAVGVYMKRDTLVETDRDVTNSSNVIVATKHYVVYLTDATKVVKVTKGE